MDCTGKVNALSPYAPVRDLAATVDPDGYVVLVGRIEE